MGWITDSDAYTIAGNCLVSEEAKSRSVYYMSNRLSPMKAWPDLATNDKMVMWGGRFLLKHLTKRVNANELLDAIRFMDQANGFGGRLKFDYNLWNRVIKEYNGVLPLCVEAIPDGSVFYPHQPMVQVTSLGNGLGEIAAHIESILVGIISTSTARATLTAHMFQFMIELIKKYNYGISHNDAVDMARWSIHDFGMRASSSSFESQTFGTAHLLFFNGTDTFNAAKKAYFGSDISKEVPYGKSILALAHRTVQSYVNEADAYNNLLKQDRIGSYVADCYDFKRAVVNHLVPLAKKNPEKTIVVRPDSGNAVENAVFTVKEAIKENLCKDGADGKEPLNLKIIEGNTVTPKLITEIYDALHKIGANPTKWIVFGIGGWLRNSCTRDTLSSAYKLSSVGENGHSRPVMKFSETEAKESIPGPVKVYNHICYPKSKLEEENVSMREFVGYNFSNFVTLYNAVRSDGDADVFDEQFWFQKARERANYQWENSPDKIDRQDIVGKMKGTIDVLRKKYK